MRKPSAVFVFRATCALIVFMLVGQIALFLLCRCQELSDNTEDELKNSKKSRSWQQNQGGLLKEIEHLRQSVKELRGENVMQMRLIESLRTRNRELSRLVLNYQRLQKVTLEQDPTKAGIGNQKGFEFPRGQRPKTEFEVIPFDSLTQQGTYHVLGGLSGNPAERPYGNRGTEHSEVTKFAVETINEDFENKDMLTSIFDLVDGLARTDRIVGSEYDLYFRTGNPNVYRRVKIHRPFGPLRLIGDIETVDTNKEWINVILPLSGRIEKFKNFMTRYKDVVMMDRRVFLTIVFFGKEDREELKSVVENFSKSCNYTDYKLLFTDELFSRGLGLQKGVVAWERGNVLMFFCDVDVYFKPDFLERCRFYSAPGVKVYYPILFSLYNPVIVYGGSVPPQAQWFRVNKETGYWRDFGFGMTCQYQSDFLAIGGFDLSIKGWGMEDVRLYRQYISSDLRIVRAPDRGIFHIWHNKQCSQKLTNSQYVACLNSKVKNEASQIQLGLLAFGKRIFDNQAPDWISQLQSSSQQHPSGNNIQSPNRNFQVGDNNKTSAMVKKTDGN